MRIFRDSQEAPETGRIAQASSKAHAPSWAGRQVACALLLLSVGVAFGASSVHTTWLWHLHQPIYWPDRRVSGPDHAEAAWNTIQEQDLGRPHPTPEVLRTIFGINDRVKAYQDEPRNALADISAYLKSGAQVSFSGALMENLRSLGAAGQLGYGGTWYQWNREARGWTTSGGHTRMDLVNFTYHHSLAPFLSDETLEMELRIHKRQMEVLWGGDPPPSRGYFPTETCFTTRMIPILKRVGIEWTVVANSHLARSCADFPVVIGSGGENCDLPNRADQLNPAQGASAYRRISIERGCGPTQVMPFGFQLHYARHVDPATGAESKLILVPSDQALGWRDGYSTWNLDLMDELAARNDPGKPALALFAHDGDNGWAGGYSYYREWVKNFTQQAGSRGYEPTTVEQFIADHPPASNDVVHIEDGGWVNADGDFGSPIFINWHWPPSYNSGGVTIVDPSLGVTDKADNWRVIVATENRVKTAQQIAGTEPRADQVRDPWSFSTTPTPVELAWHYYLAGLDSGFVYYGCNGDMCQRSSVSQSNAVRQLTGILTNTAPDLTPPTMFPPQRHPWNPGGANFGAQYNYQQRIDTNPDFWVWTYAHDVSGVTNVTVHCRVNGPNPPSGDQFMTYAGGPLTGPWLSSNMTKRVAAPVTGVNPAHIADYYHLLISGITNSYVDYYLSSRDSRGNLVRSQVYHVWVGAGTPGGGGGTNGCDGLVCLTPTPTNGLPVTISYDASQGNIPSPNPVYIHLGWNNWGSMITPDPAMTFNAASNRWLHTTTIPANATQLDCAFHNGSGTWDNNSGADWHFPVIANSVPVTNSPAFVMDGTPDFPGYALATNYPKLYAAIRGARLYLACQTAGNGHTNDHFLFVTDQPLGSATTPAPWAKAGFVAVSAGKPFISAEGGNDYVAWNNAPPGAQVAKSLSPAGVMEGSFDFASSFGGLPPVIYLAACAYGTANGGALTHIAPSGSGPNLDPVELLAVPTIALKDENADGLYDRLDPNLDFRIESASPHAEGLRFTFASVPGRSYRVLYRNELADGWSALPGGALSATGLQTTLSVTNAPGTPKRFYRIELLP
jgi:hypothetical protein